MQDRTSKPENRKLVSRFIHWLGRHEWATYFALGIIASSIWVFVEIADEVIEGETHTFDEKILLSMRNPMSLPPVFPAGIPCYPPSPI